MPTLDVFLDALYTVSPLFCSRILSATRWRCSARHNALQRSFLCRPVLSQGTLGKMLHDRLVTLDGRHVRGKVRACVMKALDRTRLATRVVRAVAPWCAWGDSLKYVWLNSVTACEWLARPMSEHGCALRV